MRSLPARRLLGLPAAALLLLVLAAPALAEPRGGRIVNGQFADQGEYPAQGFLRIDSDGNGTLDSFCGGTLVGSRQFLTAAHCTTDDIGGELPNEAFLVKLGNINRTPPAGQEDDYTVVDNDTNADFDDLELENDTAMLTLNRPANYELMRVVDDAEDSLWAPGINARIIGWGRITESGGTSQFLKEADVPMIDDTRCASSYPTNTDPLLPDKFYADTMVCAADPVGSPAPRDTCSGDSGGPLLVPDGDDFFVLVGITSWGIGCARPENPGVYSRVGDEPLNSWVHDRTPEANFAFSPDVQPQATEPATLVSTSTYPPPGPAGDDFFDTFKWDLDNDGAFDDATGKTISATFPAPGEAVVGLEASNAAAGDKASVYYAFDVGPDPTPPVAQPATTVPPVPPPVARPARLATILVSGRPRVRRGRFKLRVNFAQSAPSGIAVIEVFRGNRKIGIARTRVRRGGSKQVTVKLTPTGRRLLRRAANGRLQVRVRVRVGRRVLRTRRLTIRR